jgi:hypothetical protein
MLLRVDRMTERMAIVDVRVKSGGLGDRPIMITCNAGAADGSAVNLFCGKNTTTT